MRGLLETFIKDELVKRGYQPVYTPHIGRLELYRTSGHFPVLPRCPVSATVLDPLGQTVDTWLSLLEGSSSSPTQEKAFLNIVDALTSRHEPGDPDMTGCRPRPANRC